MRDLRKLRSKYEVKLDNRHIAYLLGASLVVVAVFFALGVVVGKGMGQLKQAERIPVELITPESTKFAAIAEPTPEEIIFPEGTPITLEETPEPIVEETPVAPMIDEQPVVTPIPSVADLAPAENSDPTQVDVGALPQPPKTGDYWSVQVGAYPTKSEAKQMADRMSARGNVSMVESADLGERGTWYRVSVGQYATEAGAKAMAAALRQRENVDTWVRYIP